MSIKVKCPHCNSSLTVPNEALGRKGRCKKCQELFTIGDNGVTPSEGTDAGPSEDEIRKLIQKVFDYGALFTPREPLNCEELVRAGDIAVPLILRTIVNWEMGEIQEEKRAHLCQVLGDIGTPKAAAALAQVIRLHPNVWEYTKTIRPAAENALARIGNKDQAKPEDPIQRAREKASANLRGNAEDGHFIGTVEALGEGADVNSTDSYGMTPLHLAAAGDSVDIVRVLVRQGAQLETRMKGGYTPLAWAVKWSNSIEVIKVLVELGADVNGGTASGSTPLALAKIRGDNEILKFLLLQGATSE